MGDETDSLELTDEELEELAEADPDPAPVQHSTQDFDVEGLVRRLIRGDIVVPTFGHGDDSIELAGFQRGFVWRRPQMDRFIESLLLGYPIPGIFLVQQADKRYLVLDGQQRLRTLAAFYKGTHGERSFKLRNVAARFEDLTYESLSAEQRRLLDNTFIQATIVQTDGSPASLEAVYQIFERLNTGGTQLTAHEIRVALYAGSFIDFITMLNDDAGWRDLYGAHPARLRDQELVLRVLALLISPGDYRRPLKTFLNDFVASHRNLERIDPAHYGKLFSDTCSVLRDGPGRQALRSKGTQVNAAFAEAIMVGLATRLGAEPPPDPTKVSEALDRLVKNEEFEGAVSKATADEESVRTRLALAIREFSPT